LANALFQTACRFDELIQLSWADCQRVGEEIVALRIKGKGSIFQDVPVPERLSAALLEWKRVQEKYKGRESFAPEGSTSRGRSLCLPGIRGLHSPTGRSTFGCGLLAECLGLTVVTGQLNGCVISELDALTTARPDRVDQSVALRTFHLEVGHGRP
jgi:integrase